MNVASIYRWLSEVDGNETGNVVPLFNDQGKPIYRGGAASARPQIFTTAEVERAYSDKNLNIGIDSESPILSRKTMQYGDVKILKPPSNAVEKGAAANQKSSDIEAELGLDLSSFKSSSSVCVTKDGAKAFVGLDCTGHKVVVTEERISHLGEGEDIAAFGFTALSSCPTHGGRSRSLSRSDAIKLPSSPFTNVKMTLGAQGK